LKKINGPRKRNTDQFDEHSISMEEIYSKIGAGLANMGKALKEMSKENVELKKEIHDLKKEINGKADGIKCLGSRGGIGF
jgi:hypothetical protein